MTWLGVAVGVLWLVLCVVWAVLSIPGGLMANASGAFTSRAQMVMLAGLAIGQLTVAASGVPLGMAISLVERRSSLLATFGWLLAAGIAMQIGSVLGFFTFGKK